MISAVGLLRAKPRPSDGDIDNAMAGNICRCATYSPRNVALANGTGSMPGNPVWRLAPRSMAWEGKSLGDICRQIRNGGKSLARIAEHNTHDGLVGWAWNPGPGRAPAPGTQAEFGALTRAWIASGAMCPE